MKNSRLKRYLTQKGKQPTSPITKKEQVKNNPDKKIDEDFPGYPHGQSKESVINPKTKQEKKTAALGVKDGEKMTAGKKKKVIDEQDSDGPGASFGGAEGVKE